jgi:hypothetical protein
MHTLQPLRAALACASELRANPDMLAAVPRQSDHRPWLAWLLPPCPDKEELLNLILKGLYHKGPTI